MNKYNGIKKIIVLVVVFVSAINLMGVSALNVISIDGSITDNEISAINALNGHVVCSINDAYQQRFFKANIIKNMKKEVDTIAIGSSHMLTLGRNNDSTSFMNLSLGASNFIDRLNVLGLLELYNVKYKNVIFEIDMPSFSELAFDEKEEFLTFHKYGKYFLNILRDEPVFDLPALDFNDSYKNEHADNKLWDLTVTYDLQNVPDGILYYKSDASQSYPKKIYETESFNWENIKTNFLEETKLMSDKHIVNRSREVLNLLMEYFNKKGINVQFVIVPKPPYLFNGDKMSTFPIINEINKYVMEQTSKYGYTVKGSFNPSDLNIIDDDFIDYFHLKQEKINELFRFD